MSRFALPHQLVGFLVIQMPRLFFFTEQRLEDHGDRNKDFLSQKNPLSGHWRHEIISNERLWQRTCQMPVEQETLVTLSASQWTA